jgi:hypothetical protein
MLPVVCNIITELTSKPNLYPWCSTSLQRDNSALFSMSSTSHISRTSQVCSALFRVEVMAPRNANVSSYRKKLKAIIAVFHSHTIVTHLNIIKGSLSYTCMCMHAHARAHTCTCALAHTRTLSTDPEFSQWQQNVK